MSGGLKIGGQQYSQMIVFETPGPLANFKNGDFKLSADASAVALRSGAAATATFKDNVQVYIWDQAGLMADASVGAQTFRYTPSDDAAQAAGSWQDADSDVDTIDQRQAEYQGYQGEDARPAGEELDSGDHNIQRQDMEIKKDHHDMELRTESDLDVDVDAQPAGAKMDTPTQDMDIRSDYRTTPDGNLNRRTTPRSEERRVG